MYDNETTMERTVLPRIDGVPQYSTPFSSKPIQPVKVSAPLKKAKVTAVVLCDCYIQIQSFFHIINPKKLPLTMVDLHFQGGVDMCFNMEKQRAIRFSDVFNYQLETQVLRNTLLTDGTLKILSNNCQQPSLLNIKKVHQTLSELGSIEERIYLWTPNLLLHYDCIQELVDELIIILNPTPKGVSDATAAVNSVPKGKVKVKIVKSNSFKSSKTRAFRDKQVQRMVGKNYTKVGEIID